MRNGECGVRNDRIVTASRTTFPKRWMTGAVWLAFAAIAILYFFGLAASSVIPFGPSMSIASVARRVSAAGLFSRDVSMVFHGLVLASSIVALLVHTFSRSRRVRIAVALLCLCAPLFWTAGGAKGIAQWLLAMPAAPFFTVTALAGSQDGEFYSEGFLVFTAVGWWMILWCVLVFHEIRFARRQHTL